MPAEPSPDARGSIYMCDFITMSLFFSSMTSEEKTSQDWATDGIKKKNLKTQDYIAAFGLVRNNCDEKFRMGNDLHWYIGWKDTKRI